MIVRLRGVISCKEVRGRWEALAGLLYSSAIRVRSASA